MPLSGASAAGRAISERPQSQTPNRRRGSEPVSAARAPRGGIRVTQTLATAGGSAPMNITLNPKPCRRPPDDLLPPGGVKTVQLSFKISPAGLREAPARAPAPGRPHAWPGRPPAVRSEACARAPAPGHTHAWPAPRHTARLAPEPRPLAIPTPGRPNLATAGGSAPMNITLNPKPCRRPPDDLLPPGGVKTVQLSFKISPTGLREAPIWLPLGVQPL